MESKTNAENTTRTNGKDFIRFCPVHVKGHLPILLGKNSAFDFASDKERKKTPHLTGFLTYPKIVKRIGDCRVQSKFPHALIIGE